MKMTLRWFGENQDKITLEQIGQIPGIDGVVTSFLDIPAGEVWPLERIRSMRDRVAARGLKVEVIESVNIHEDIKLGLPSRDRYIDNYIETLRNLRAAFVCGVSCRRTERAGRLRCVLTGHKPLFAVSRLIRIPLTPRAGQCPVRARFPA